MSWRSTAAMPTMAGIPSSATSSSANDPRAANGRTTIPSMTNAPENPAAPHSGQRASCSSPVREYPNEGQVVDGAVASMESMRRRAASSRVRRYGRRTRRFPRLHAILLDSAGGVAAHYDYDAFGQFSESIARTLGTARFLEWQSFVIIAWIIYNFVLPESWQFDPWSRGLVLLTLVLSLQASYAAPLILLAQNRQEGRDRTQAEVDRRVAERTQAETEFLAREIASVRVSLTDMVTTQDLRDHLDAEEITAALTRLADVVENLSSRIERIENR